MPQAIHLSPIDNVVVALHPIAKGTLVEVDGLSVTALEDIPQGHKMAVKPIKNGENVIKYGFPIGHFLLSEFQLVATKGSKNAAGSFAPGLPENVPIFSS